MADDRTYPKREAHRGRSLRVNERDVRLVCDIYSHRAMTRDQIIALGYFHSVPRCNDRLMQLCRFRLLKRFFRSFGSTQGIYLVAENARALIARRLGCDPLEVARQVQRRQAPLFLDHTLAVVDFRIQLEREVSKETMTVAQWLPESLCCHEYSYRDAGGGRWHDQVLRPDAYFSLSTPGGRQSFFVEIDMGHVSSEKFARKIESYRTYAKLGLFTETFHQPKFSVLIVTTTERRLVHLQHLKPSPIEPWLAFTTFDRISRSGILPEIGATRLKVSNP